VRSRQRLKKYDGKSKNAGDGCGDRCAVIVVVGLGFGAYQRQLLTRNADRLAEFQKAMRLAEEREASLRKDRDELMREVEDQPHARTLFWSQDKVPGRDAWGTIYSWIDSADLVVVVLTGKALSRALSVGNEVGYARKAGKRIIPLVGPEVPKGELGICPERLLRT
jgi:hypothetical protein